MPLVTELNILTTEPSSHRMLGSGCQYSRHKGCYKYVGETGSKCSFLPLSSLLPCKSLQPENISYWNKNTDLGEAPRKEISLL